MGVRGQNISSRAPNGNDFYVKNIKVGENPSIALYTRYSIVARALGLAFRPSKGILHTTHSGAYCFCMQYTFARALDRPSVRATIGYLVYNPSLRHCSIHGSLTEHTKCKSCSAKLNIVK